MTSPTVPPPLETSRMVRLRAETLAILLAAAAAVLDDSLADSSEEGARAADQLQTAIAWGHRCLTAKPRRSE